MWGRPWCCRTAIGGHELAGRVRRHLRSVVGHGEQDRPGRVVDGEVEAFIGEQLEQALGFDGGLEDDLDLGGGLFDGHERVDPLARDHVDDGEHDASGVGEVGGVVDPDPVRFPDQPVGPWLLLRSCPGRRFGQHEPVSSENSPERRGCHPHETLVGPAVGELAVGPVDRTPPLGDVQDGVDLAGQDAVHRVPARGPVHQGAQVPAPGPPPMHPIVGDLPQRTDPVVRQPVGDRVIDGLEDQLLDFGGDSRRERSAQPQPDFPRITASSIACALIASVNAPISA